MVVDLIWVVTDPNEGVEHIAAHAVPGGIEIGVFSTRDNAEVALATAQSLVRRVCERSAPLRGWTWSTPST